jgi:hypothetical protein
MHDLVVLGDGIQEGVGTHDRTAPPTALRMEFRRVIPAGAPSPGVSPSAPILGRGAGLVGPRPREDEPGPRPARSSTSEGSWAVTSSPILTAVAALALLAFALLTAALRDGLLFDPEARKRAVIAVAFCGLEPPVVIAVRMTGRLGDTALTLVVLFTVAGTAGVFAAALQREVARFTRAWWLAGLTLVVAAGPFLLLLPVAAFALRHR